VSEGLLKALSDQYLCLLGRGYTTIQDEFEELENTIYYKLSNLTVQSLVDALALDTGAKEESTSASTLIVKDLYWTGIELFKQKSEQISDFAFDNTSHTNNIALGLMTSGCREIPIVNTLLFRNRIENGLQLIDEENLSWEECLHRYDALEQIMYSQSPDELITAKDEPVISVIDSMFAHKTINFRSRPL